MAIRGYQGTAPVIAGNVYVDPSAIVIGAGTLVPPGKVLESGYLYLGNPVRQARQLTAAEPEFFHYTSRRYVNLAAQYRAEKAGG